MYLFEITNGETTISLKNTSGVCVEYNRWSPAISGWTRGEYPPVHDSIPVVIRGTSGTDVMQKLRELQRLVDLARRWFSGENVAPVHLRYQQTASSAIFATVIIGGSVIAPSNFTNQENWKTLYPVYLELDRRGQWVTPDTSNIVTNGGFETWAGDPLTPTGWTIAEPLLVARESTIKRTGLYSAKLSNFALFENIQQFVPARNGQSVKVSAWIYVESGDARMMVYTFDVTPTQTIVEEIGSWVYVEVEAVAGYSTIESDYGVLVLFTWNGGAGSVFYVDDVSVTILNESGESGDIATADGITNGDGAVLVFPATPEPFPSPTTITITNYLAGLRHPQAFVVVSAAGNIRLINAELLTVSAPFSIVAETAAYARGGKVLRFTPTNTAEQSVTFSIAAPGNLFRPGRAAVFANVRNNFAVPDYTLRCLSAMPGGKYLTRPVLVGAEANGSPRWIFLGTLPIQASNTLSVLIRASAASGTFDINSFAVVSLDDGSTSIVSIDQTDGVGNSSAITAVINHQILTDPTPGVNVIYDTRVTRWSARGDIAVYTQANALTAVLLATGGASTENRWRQEASAAVIENDWTASRLPGRLSPE
jgi:hypothetical protein